MLLPLSRVILPWQRAAKVQDLHTWLTTGISALKMITLYAEISLTKAYTTTPATAGFYFTLSLTTWRLDMTHFNALTTCLCYNATSDSIPCLVNGPKMPLRRCTSTNMCFYEDEPLQRCASTKICFYEDALLRKCASKSYWASTKLTRSGIADTFLQRYSW